jgi:hypothetical protein
MTSTQSRIFLLSPAHCDGLRARLVMSARAGFPLALRLREPPGAPLGEVFSFLSGLYFRGKLAYARAFAAPPDPACPGVLVITPAAGLVPADTPVTAEVLRRFARTEIDARNPRYRRPLLIAARMVADRIGREGEVVLLGSIASGKYVDVLVQVFGDRLTFPTAFVGRGDMSRGGLMLRCVAERRELEYASVVSAIRHGPRPPRLPPLPSRALRSGA